MMKNVLVCFLVFVILLAGALAFCLMAPWGSQFVIRKMISSYLRPNTIQIGQMRGALASGLSLDDILLTNINVLPEGNRLRIQHLYFALNPFKRFDWTINVDHARLQFPETDPVIIFGTLKNQSLDFNCFAPSLTLNDFRNVFPEKNIPWKVKNVSLSNVDIFLRGDIHNPDVTGTVVLSRLSWQKITLLDMPATLNLTMEDFDIRKLTGEILVPGGMVTAGRTSIAIHEGKMFFKGETLAPSFDVNGQSTIDKVDISVHFQGTFKEPNIRLTSDPPLSQEQLMVMLATGKGWAGVTQTFEEGQFSANATRDFVDYFIFSGQGGQFAQRLGIHDVSITFDKEKKGIAAKKSISQRFDVGFGLEQENIDDEDILFTRTVGGELKVTDTFSLEAQQAYRQYFNETVSPDEAEPLVPDSTILLKYKKNF
ncbi:MAG: translocation/assembly module TamB domain-containing protein [Candidatus Omnitrophota bacterium]|nr:translocation/assembly module TamB domain-containing protein [Candidatus Omnitrophota bacterium]